MKKYILVLIAFILVSCNFNKIYHNREEDKKESEKITEKFYALIKENNRQEAFRLASKNLFRATSKDNFNKILDNASIECGSIKNYSLNHWETIIIKGNNPRGEYVLIYDVNRSIKNTKEKFTLKKENDSIKILGYNIQF